MNPKEYKKYHEEHMMHNTGTTIEECCLLISSIPFFAFLSSHFALCIPKGLIPVIEFFIIIVPVILNCTVFSEIHDVIFLNILLLSTALIIMKIDVSKVKNVLSSEVVKQNSFISNFRASTNFVSAICILAVDFVVFPKRFTKTESFGFGFMDLGVGFFICANGFVEKHSISKDSFFKVVKTECVLCTLGLIRVFTVKSIDYHEHVSEYGVHWNFFFTLALCRLLSYLINHFSSNANPLYLSIIIGGIYQLLLLMGLQQWVLIDKPRDSFLIANREGLVSSLGYISLYFATCAIGKYVLHSKNLTYNKLLIKLLFISVFAWLGTAVSCETIKVSRRLVNLGYIFWILALSVTEIILFVVLEILIISKETSKTQNIPSVVPSVLESINRNGLFFFIASNLLTGLVNIIFQTLLLGKIISMIIIISYMAVLCGLTQMLFLKKLKL